MQTGFTKNLAVFSSLALGVSFLAYAQLGGAGGVVFPYAGYLERDSIPLNETVDITVEVYSQASGGVVCDTNVIGGVLVSNGSFSISVGPVDEDCVLDKSVFLEVLVEGTRLGGRTQVRPALQAYTGARGDFDVPQLLSAGNITTTNSVFASALGSAIEPVATADITTVNSTTTNSTTVNSTTVNSTTSNAGRVNATGAGTGLSVTNNATIGGTLTVNGNVNFANNGCPAGTARMGSWCITNNQGGASYGNAITNCNNLAGGPFQVCPLEAIVHCDQINFGGSNCGTLTDLTDTVQDAMPTTTILTSTIAVGSVELNESIFDNATCYFSQNRFDAVNINWSNGVVSCAAGQAYFCCKSAF